MNIKDLKFQKYSNIRILVDLKDYNIEKDTQILIPFSYYQHYGLMNKNGEIVVEPKFDRILDSCHEKRDVVRVGINYTYGFNRKTKEPSTYLSTKWGLVDSTGNILLEPEYRGIGISDDKRLLTLQHMDYQYEVINIDGEVIIPKGEYPYIDSFDRGYVRVNSVDGENKRWGLIDSNGKVVLPLIYSNIWNFVGKNGSWVTIESIDEYGNKHTGKFDFLTRKTDI